MSAPNVFLLLAESFRTKRMPQHLYGTSTYQHLEYTRERMKNASWNVCSRESLTIAIGCNRRHRALTER